MKKTLLSVLIASLFTTPSFAQERLPNVPDLPERRDARPRAAAMPLTAYQAPRARQAPRSFEPRIPNLPEHMHTWYGRAGEQPPAMTTVRAITPTVVAAMQPAVSQPSAVPSSAPASPAAPSAPSIVPSWNPLRALAERLNQGIGQLRRAPAETTLAASADAADSFASARASSRDAEALTPTAPAIALPKPPVVAIMQEPLPEPPIVLAQAAPAAVDAPAPIAPALAAPITQVAPAPAEPPQLAPAVPIAPAPVATVQPPQQPAALRPTQRRAPAPPQAAQPPAQPSSQPAPQLAQQQPFAQPAAPLVTANAEPAPTRVRAMTAPPLDNTSREAVRQSQDFMMRDNAPTLGEDGRVVFTYGAGQPVVVCAPLRICAVELQPGERVTGPLHAGDTVRWHITPAESGVGKNATTHIIIKPKDVGLETNLLIPTDRRVYYLRLVSRSSDFVARVSFAYPDDVRAAWEAYQQRQNETQRAVVSDLPPLTAEKLFFEYEIEGKESFRPVRVFDDGQKTYIQLPEGTRHREQPALILNGPSGQDQIVNYRVRNDYLIVDRLFDRAALIIGVGRQQQKVSIARKDAPRSASTFGRWFRSNGGNEIADTGGGGSSYAQ